MSLLTPIKRANTILYCEKWTAMVHFYRDSLALPISFQNDWFIEFQLTAETYLSIAQAKRAIITSSQGAGITLTFAVEDVRAVWHRCQTAGLNPTPLKDHPWGATQFFLFDPEGYRLEIWQADHQKAHIE